MILAGPRPAAAERRAEFNADAARMAQRARLVAEAAAERARERRARADGAMARAAERTRPVVLSRGARG